MIDPKLIILYGKFGKKLHEKQQRMIDGGSSCGYRDYARLFGEIIYLCPQRLSRKWEKSITEPQELVRYLNSQENVVVWSVKHDPAKDACLDYVKHPKLYYSCCAYNTINRHVDYSLVDTIERVKPGTNAVLWQKGKDPEKWNYDPEVKRVYDYLLVGRRADKNEIWFIDKLTKKVKEQRSILWIGGKEHRYKFNTHHYVKCTPFVGESEVIKLMNKCYVHVLLSEHPAEGFPQSIIESGMCGCCVIYSGPRGIFENKEEAFSHCEDMLLVTSCGGWEKLGRRESKRKLFVDDYSIHKSWEQMKGYFL